VSVCTTPATASLTKMPVCVVCVRACVCVHVCVRLCVHVCGGGGRGGGFCVCGGGCGCGCGHVRVQTSCMILYIDDHIYSRSCPFFWPGVWVWGVGVGVVTELGLCVCKHHV